MKFRSTGNTKGFNIHFDDTNEKLKIQLNDSSTTPSGTTDMMTLVGPQGYVGIGTDSPDYILDIKGTGTTVSTNFCGDNTTTTSVIRVSNSGSADLGNEAMLHIGTTQTFCYFSSVYAYPLYLQTNNIQRMIIDSNGNVIIGGQTTTTASAKLDVIGDVKATKFIGDLEGNADTATKIASITNSDIVQKNASTTEMSGGLNIEGTFRIWSITGFFGSYSIGLEVDLWIFCGLSSTVLSASDERIKTDIVDCSNSLALDKFRQLDLKYYNYKDTSKRGPYKTIGIIAQKLKEVFPSAVGIMENAIPDELKDIDTTEWETIDTNNNIYKLNTNIENAAGIKYRFYVGDNRKKKDIIANSDGTFTFDKKYDNIYCYGKVVNDFHIVNKEKLYMYNISATQEIDRIQQEEKTKLASAEEEITTLKTQLASAEAEITALKTQLAAVLARLDALESN